MIKELSLEILNTLNAAGLDTQQISFQEIVDRQVGALERPAVNISVDQGTFQKVTMTSYKSMIVVSLYIMIQNVAGEKERRFTVYDLLEAIVSTLLLKDFGLSLQDHMRPQSFNNVTDKKFSDAGYSIYQINFLTSFIFTKEPSEEEQDIGILKTIVSDFFLQDPTDDGISDKQTIVTFITVNGGNAYTSDQTEIIYGGRARTNNYREIIYGGKANTTF